MGSRLFRRAAALCALLATLAAAIGSAPAAAEDVFLAHLTGELARSEAQHGKTSPELLPVIDALAAARMQAGALAEAAALRRRALDIALAAYGSGSPRAASAMAALARLDLARERYLDAEPLLIIAERVLLAAKTPDPSQVAVVQAELARVALARGDTDRAERWARHAVSRGAQGSTASLRVLGAALARRGKFIEGARVLRRALSQDRRRHGGDDAETARTLVQFGNLYLREKRPEAALPFLERAAAIDRDRLGPDHPFIADDLHDVAVACEALHRDGLARRLLNQALAILQRGGAGDTPRAAYIELELSRVYEKAGDHAAAEAALKAARGILDNVHAERHRRERKV